MPGALTLPKIKSFRENYFAPFFGLSKMSERTCDAGLSHLGWT